ncbi:MAG: aminomethyltransferase [Alphaproteobacteria bacterium]|nr:aminomethyltransferase [Alphaproteobacteria bacterium]
MTGRNRLSAPAGKLIDRDQPLTFKFEGQLIDGYAGDTIASALAANDVWVLSRSFKYRRPRGALTMAGQDANTLVQLPGRPNVLADLEPISDGLDASGQNYEGSLTRDRGVWIGWLHRFLPVGFYYKAFYKPRGAWKFWAPFIRAKAGLGRVSEDAPHGYYDKEYRFADVAVVGGGPAGLSAALTAADAGADVILIDENPQLGGALNYARFDVAGAVAGQECERLVNAVLSHNNIDVMSSTVANGWFADNFLSLIRGNRMFKLRAKEVVLATGAMEQPAVFRNNDLPRVMMGSAAQRFIHLYGVCPGTRAIVLAANDDAYGVALDLADAGIDIVVIADLRERPDAGPLSAAVQEKGWRIETGCTVSEALAGEGSRSVQGAVLSRIDGKGIAGGGETLTCDLICMSVGYAPVGQLPCHDGGQLRLDPVSSTFVLENLPDHGHAAGSVSGTHSLDAVVAEGARAGWRAARASGFDVGDEPEVPDARGAEGCNHDWPIFPHVNGKDFVDFDEDLQVQDILNACADGYDDIELVKRYSTVGMGPSQGRHSALNTVRLVTDATGRSLDEAKPTTVRPPYTAETFGVLAGRVFEPVRYTPMHHRHLEAGAQMMVAGPWMRPAYYGAPDVRDQAIRDEVAAVRIGVGVLDVSTLGGIEIRGPDAAEFLNRMYTFAYARQPVGRSRYLMMCDETGAIVDDGVTCRFHERHFYVTTTSSGASNVYREMLWWNAQWRLATDISDVTNAYAAVSLAGPQTRKVLDQLTEDIDLSLEAFPYMDVRTGHVAGIPARLLRIGFVGELGFEIHVPSSQGEALWDALMSAGEQFDIRPFGLEAQRVLRLEKGHVIIGQDTDGLTFPAEANMTWAISRKKPFFVGGRANQVHESRPLLRKLVGFAIDDPKAPVPEECHLTLQGNDIVGRVTSAARSEALGRIIGLAYVAPSQAETGATFPIKIGTNRFLEATVVPVPFYDPDNKRQEM